MAGLREGASMTAGANHDISFALNPTAEPVSPARRAELMADPGFGRVFTDHMVTIAWTAEVGWHDAQLRPFGPLSLNPASHVFHYGQEIFEGLKAYRQAGGPIVMFRPAANAARFINSARRMAMPELSEDTFIHAIELLVAQDREWVPAASEQSLYLRPFMIATHVGLSVSHPSSSFLFAVIASPAGAYFRGGLRPVSVWLADGYIRAAVGGTGAAKTGGNYAGGMIGQRQAMEHGCDQVVWLDAAERRWVEELGGMNLFFVFGTGDDARIVTPPLTGTLLPGVVRDSLLTLAADLGIPASEEPISVDEWRAGCKSGEISEVFACGTAAVVTPVGEVRGSAGGWSVGSEVGPVTTRLRDQLLGIQFGQLPDPHGWVHKIC
jgi:branched-chain amino acid aminotransferase